MEILNNDLFIAWLNKVLLWFLDNFNHWFILRRFRILNEVLEELEKECSVETVAISPKSPDFRVSSVELVKAELELVVLVLSLEHSQINEVTDEWRLFLNLLFNSVLIVLI